MPELPEVDAITGVARKYAAGKDLEWVEIVRSNGKYFGMPRNTLGVGAIDFRGTHVVDVTRIGKHVIFALRDGYIVAHNAMTGYFDWEHDPWTFDYVEGKRESNESDVRVRFIFGDHVLRFHDARLFGRMEVRKTLPMVGPELMQTPNGMVGRPIITQDQFYAGLQVSHKDVKVRLMDQDFVCGIGNIYSNEACHRAGIKPNTASNVIGRLESDSLHQALLDVVGSCFPQVRYDWLKVYRRVSCGTCGKQVKRTELKGRATFHCGECQL